MILAALANVLLTSKPVSLFNGKDLSGWTVDCPAVDKKEKNARIPFTVRNGLLVSLGTPGGHLVSNKLYSNYKVDIEYRFTGRPGNCGVLVHASKPRRLYEMFPQSIEVQMQSGDAGDFWCIGENITVDNMVERRGPKEKWGVDGDKNRRIANLTDNSEKPLAQWNHMTVVCSMNTVKVWVNGDLVNYGYGATVSRGKIALQSEGVEVEFRKVMFEQL